MLSKSLNRSCNLFKFDGLKILNSGAGQIVGYIVPKSKKMDGLNLSVQNEFMFIWLRNVHADQPKAETPLAILPWLARLGIHNIVVFALRCHLCSFLCAVSCSTVVFLKCKPFPYDKEKCNVWFIPPSLKDKREKSVHVINVNDEGEKLNCHKTQHHISNFPSSLADDKYEVFFHGTTHESAQNIIENNIILSKGDSSSKADFSCGWGFYLGNDFDNTLRAKWRRNRPRCSAVLVFRVSKAELRERRNGWDLQRNLEDWKTVIRQFRGSKPPSRRFLATLDTYDFIEGPLFGEGQSLTDPIPNEGSYQLCVRSNVCARLFDQSLHSVLFFER